MKKIVLSGFVFLSGIIMLCTWLIIDGGFILYPSILFILIGVIGIITTDYKE